MDETRARTENEYEQLPLPLGPDLPHKTLIRPDEAAKFFSVSRTTIYRWCEEGRLMSSCPSEGVLRIFRSSILDLLQKNIK